MRWFRQLLVPGLTAALVLVWTTARLPAQSGTGNGEWRTYGADLANTRYAPLDQVNASNFSKLELA